MIWIKCQISLKCRGSDLCWLLANQNHSLPVNHFVCLGLLTWVWLTKAGIWQKNSSFIFIKRYKTSNWLYELFEVIVMFHIRCINATSVSLMNDIVVIFMSKCTHFFWTLVSVSMLMLFYKINQMAGRWVTLILPWLRELYVMTDFFYYDKSVQWHISWQNHCNKCYK